MDDERTATPEPVTETYDRIAEHFASTREYPWPEVAAFLGRDVGGDLADDAAALADGAAPALERIRSAADDGGGVGLDLGCGNGRHAELLAEDVERVVGADASRGLLGTARKRAQDREFDVSLHLVQADAAGLPLRSDVVDVAVYVATLHHLRTRDQRVASLSELARVLAPGGRAIVSVWSTAHDRFEASSGFDTTVEWTLPGGERVPRYYHIYDPAEFEADLAASDLQTVDSVVSSGNCYAVVEAGARTRSES
ncbi:class I SAM-dependent methyltransferase [Halobellus sp. Atlit-38R]|uniref:class I SAM-dependent methyltransferase n=1 Tax=Halobellus sp. Atlit-38R TaxID=2282131 RepID=UPI000EF1C81F|nr:class I SAM-dependent methyltransferase [Halobellus sp. Atlit-38R]RLM90202.1 class I SAM-dependent methyltransferase [Halobellus sp. Atlit-38R]